MTRNIILYTSSSPFVRVPVEAFISGREALSGTDGQFLNLFLYLRSAGHFNVLLLLRTDLDPQYEGVRNIGLRADFEKELSSINQSFRADLVIAIERTGEAYLGEIKTFEKLGLPFMLSVQNGPNRGYAGLYRSMRMLRKLVCVSRGQALSVMHLPIFSRMIYIYNSLDVDDFPLPPTPVQAPVFTYIGAIADSKGFQHLAAIWSRVLEQLPDAQLNVVGSIRLYDKDVPLGKLGISTPEFEEQYLKRTIGDTPEAVRGKNIILHGLKNRSELKEILGRTKVGIVNPNLTGSFETFCVTAIEMEAMGLPVICGDRLGLKETVLGQPVGYRFNSYDEFLSAIVRLGKRTVTNREAARGFVADRFAPAKIYAQWVDLIDRVCEGRDVRLRPSLFRDVRGYKDAIKYAVYLKNRFIK